MAECDGSVTLKTNIDTDGLKNGKSTIKNAAREMGNEFGKQSKQIQAALNSGNAKVTQLANNFQRATLEVEKQARKVDELKSKLAGLESGDIAPQDSIVADIQKTLDTTTAGIEKTKNEIASLYMQLDQLQSNAFKGPSGDVVLTKSEQAEFDKLSAKLDELEPKLVNDTNKAKALGKALKTAVGIATQAEIEKTKQKLEEAELKLDGAKIKAKTVGQNLNNAMLGTDKAIKGTSSGLEKLGKRILRLGTSALVFSAITKGFTLMREHIGAALMSNEDFRASTYQLQAALWVVAEPIYQSILPAIQTLIRWLTIGMLYIATFFNTLRGKTLKEGIKAAKALQKQSEAYKNTAKSAGGATSANKKAAKSMKDLAKETEEANKNLADFDELMILSEDKLDEINTPSGSSAGSTLGGVSSGFDDLESLLNDSDMQNLTDFQEWVTENKGAIETALEIAGLGLLGLGIGSVIKKIGNLLGWFKKKDDGLDRQTKKTQRETEAVTEMSNAFATVPGYASVFAFGLDSVTDSAMGLIPQLGDATDGAYGLAPAVDMVTESLFGTEPALSNATQNLYALTDTEEPIKNWSSNIAYNITTAMDSVASNVYESLLSTGTNINNWVTETSTNFANWGMNVADNMYATASNIASNWGEALSTAWTNFKNFMTATGEKISGFWNENKASVITVGVLAGLTFTGIALAPYTGGASLMLPALARGAVLPANQPFLAMLGDQKNGRNLEAPEGLIRQIFQEEMARMDYNGRGNTPVILELDGRELGRAIINAGKSESRRLGTKVVYG